MNHSQTKNLVGTALCIALGLILPQVFHLIGAGPVFLPMHIPVLLCGLCFGWPFGLVCAASVLCYDRHAAPFPHRYRHGF